MTILRRGSLFALVLGLAVFASSAQAAATVQPTPNANAMAIALSGTPLDPAINTDFGILGFNNATAELYANGMLTSLSTQRIFRDTLPSVADYTQTAHRQASENYCGPIAGSICQPGSKWVMWDTPFLQFDTRKSNDGYLGYKYEASGFATGITRLIGEYSAVGLALGYDAREQKGKDGYHQKLKGDAFHAALYGGTNMGAFFFDAYAGFSWTSLRSNRKYSYPVGMPVNQDRDTINFMDNDLRGNYNDNILSGGLKASYVWALPKETRIIPSIGLDYSRVHINSIQETGLNAISQLRVDSETYNAVQMPITVAANRTFACDFLSFGGINSLWTPEVRGGWVPQFGKSRAEVTAYEYFPNTNYTGTFNSKSTDIGDSYGTVGAGLKIQIKDKFIFALDYDYRFGKKYSSHVLTGTYGVSF